MLGQKKVGLAIQAYERAFKISKSGQLVVKIHQALVIDGKAKDADVRVTQWLKEHAEDNNVRMYFAMYNLTNPKTKQIGIDQLQAMLKNDGNNVLVLNNLAWALNEDKNPKALEYAERAYKVASNNAAVMDTLGWILIEQGNTGRGLPLIQKAMIQMPESLDVRYHLGVGLMKSGNKTAARKEFEQIQSSGKEFPKKDEMKGLLKQL